MRIKMMVPLTFMLAFLTLNAYSIIQPTEVSTKGGESLADKLIEESKGDRIYTHPDAEFAETPRMSRGQLEQENHSIIWTPILKANTTITVGSVGAQEISPGQVTATVNWPKPCCYVHYGSFSPTVTLCNGLSETIAGNTTLTVSKSGYQKSVVHGPFSCDSGCLDLDVSWQIPITAPTGTYDVMISIRPTASPYFNPIVIQKDRAFFVTPSGGPGHKNPKDMALR